MLRTFSIVATFLAVVGGIAIAQELPDAPSVTVGTFPSVQSARRPKQEGARVAAIKPVFEPAIASGTYWASTFALVSTTVINVEMTTRCAEQHTCLSQIAPNSTRARLYAYTLPTDILVSYLSYKIKGRTRWWIVPQVVLTGANLFSAGRSYGRLR